MKRKVWLVALALVLLMGGSAAWGMIPVDIAVPDLLNGVWIKSIDQDTVEIMPGNLEIRGLMHTQSTPVQLTLSGNLAEGETEGASKYYYLYAIKADDGIPTYKFSEILPSKDRFDNTISFDTADPGQGLYHPNNNTWRYIGQIYNDNSSNILPFDKCKPGYWESAWTIISSVGCVNLPHALGRIPMFRSIHFTENLNVPYVASFTSFYYSSGVQSGTMVGAGVSTISKVRVFFSPGRIWFDDSNIWHGAGYYKLIVTAPK